MPDQAEWTDPLGVPVRIFARGWNAPARDYFFAAGVAWTLWKERRNYQLIYFLMQGLHLAAGLPVARFLGKPVVMKISGSSIITMMGQSLLGRLELRWLQKWAHRVMILNAGMEQEALAAGFRKDHLYWMPNPVDTDEFAPVTDPERPALRRRFQIPAEAPIIVYIGRLAPEKELDSLLRAFARTLEQVADARLVMVGDGPERAALEECTRRLQLMDRVVFTGRQSLEEVRCRLQCADVFALVSSNEGFSCSLVEAMSVGLPSVVSDIPANRQLIEDGVQGFCAPVRDEAALAAALATLLLDAPLRTAMGTAARRRVLDHYSMDKVLDEYESLFHQALKH